MEDPEAREMEGVTQFYRSMLALERTDDRRAVGWKTEEIERRQHASVSELFSNRRDAFEVYEVGCGLGAYARFLQRHLPNATYRGCDLLVESVDGARSRVPGIDVEVRDVTTEPPPEADYVVASGTFNTSGGVSDERWMLIVQRALRAMFDFARIGVSVTFLTDRVDWRRQLGAYCDPVVLFRFAETELSRFVELRCGYHPWEFTLHVLRGPRPITFGPPPVTWPPASRERPDDGAW